MVMEEVRGRGGHGGGKDVREEVEVVREEKN